MLVRVRLPCPGNLLTSRLATDPGSRVRLHAVRVHELTVLRAPHVLHQRAVRGAEQLHRNADDRDASARKAKSASK